jgi:hypothetical protein|nr:MAG TPA: hypothetical protein [Caudoviricetes sp.]
MYYFPYTNFHDLNLDWIIEYVKSAKSEIEDLINQFENLIVQTTGDSTNKVMSQNAVTMQVNFLSSRINTLNTTVEELTAKLNKDIANLAEFETETASNFSSVRSRLTTIEKAITRFYVFVTHTATGNTINVSMSELLNYRTRANVRYYIVDSVNNFVRCAYEAYSPSSTTMMIQTLPYTNENAVYRATIDITSGSITYATVGIVPISQSSGQSQTSVMSQRAVTEFVNNLILYVIFTITADTSRCNYSFNTIYSHIANNRFVYGNVRFVEKNVEYFCSVYEVGSERIIFRAIPSYDSSQSLMVVLSSFNVVSYTKPILGVLPYYPRYVISSDGETISSGQLTILQNILNAIVNNYSPQIYLNITTDKVTEQLYVDGANSAGYVLRNNNYIITYTTAPSVTIEHVEKVFTSSSTGIKRLAAGGETGYNILQITGSDVDLTDYYIVDADITNLIGGVSTLISVSPVSGAPVILIYSNGVAFSGSWTVTCRHK